MWSPSSLIFLVLLGVWAAYFLQYWIRRRDHLATARSVEQFSEAIRVLERRDTTPRTDLSEPAPRSWDVRPGTAARPQVLVKRAVPVEPSRPVLSQRVRREPEPPRAEAVQSRAAETSPSGSSTPRPERVASATPRAPAGQPRGGERRPAPRPAQAPGPRQVRPSRRVRAVLMLLTLAGLVAVSVLVGLGRLQLWAIAPAAAGFLVAFAYVRAGVRSQQALLAARRRRGGEHVRGSSAREERRPSRDERAREGVDGAAARAASDGAAGADGATAVAAATATGDLESEISSAEPEPDTAGGTAAGVDTTPEATGAVDTPDPAEEVEFVHLVDEDDIPLTWEPVPVPRPTYTMKARAERPDVPPADVTPEPEPVALTSDDDSLEERRVAGA